MQTCRALIYSIVEEQLIDDTYFCYSEFRANALIRQTEKIFHATVCIQWYNCAVITSVLIVAGCYTFCKGRFCGRG